MNNKVIKKVLMCEPRFFQVQYEINPWMKIGSIDPKKAFKQWEELYKTYLKMGIAVDLIEPQSHLPDMVFSADQGLVKKKTVIISNFHYPQRRKEAVFYENWYKNNSFDIRKISENLFFEGSGESLWWGEKLFVGKGFRNSEGIELKLKEALGVEAVALELINPYFYHLDTCLFPLNKDTVFYYPEAFSSQSLETLKKIVPDLIPIEKKEAFNFAANSILTDHHVVTEAGNPRFKGKLKAYGYEIVEVDVSEFFKAGGGIHCLTGVVAEGLSLDS